MPRLTGCGLVFMVFMFHRGLLLQGAASQNINKDECVVGNLSSIRYVYTSVRDVENETFLSLETQFVKSIEIIRHSSYALISFENETFTIRPSPEFATFEENNSPDSYIVEEIRFNCGIGNFRRYIFMFDVIDTNNHDPQFIDGDVSTEYTVFTPLGKGFPIIPLYGELGAMDYDFTTKNISFVIEENPFFDISFLKTATIESRTVYFASVTTKRIIYNIPTPLKMKITITDNDNTNNERRSYSKYIIIKGSTTFDIPIIKFEKPYYIGEMENAELSFPEPITLVGSTDSPSMKNLNVYVDKEYITVTLDTDTMEVKIGLKNDFQGDEIFQIDIRLGKDSLASTIVQILSGVEIHSQFSQISTIIALSTLWVISILTILIFIFYFRAHYTVIAKKAQMNSNLVNVISTVDTNHKRSENGNNNVVLLSETSIRSSVDECNGNLVIKLPPEKKDQFTQ